MALLPQSLSWQPHSLPFSQAKRRTPLVQPLSHTTSAKRLNLSICLASSSNPSPSVSSDLVELPIFPLPLVLFPGAVLPLQIFEFRYRIMMHTLLQTDLRFGVLFSNPSPSHSDPSSPEVGCVAEVVKHQRLVDDRFFLICKGQVRC